MELVEKLLIAWVILSVLILSITIINFVLAIQNRKDINKLQSNS